MSAPEEETASGTAPVAEPSPVAEHARQAMAYLGSHHDRTGHWALVGLAGVAALSALVLVRLFRRRRR